MRKVLIAGIFVCAVIAAAWAQQSSYKTYDWVRASDEIVRLDPADYHSGRVYHPGPDGGNMHVIIQAKQPVTLAMVFEDEWNAVIQHPETVGSVDFRCLREHVSNTTYECHLPASRPMVLVLHDERTPDRAIFHGIGAIISKGAARQLISPNDVQISYHSWSCVANCIQPEFRWIRLVKEKYELTSTPKLYSILSPERDGEKLWMKIKAPVPMTLAVVSSKIADQVYDKPETLSSVLPQTSCKQRGLQTLEFDCTFNQADGPQSLLVLPDAAVRSHKKAEIQVQAYKCSANCKLLNVGVKPEDTGK